MLKSDIAVGSAMYQALVGNEAKRAALQAAASIALPQWQSILLTAVQKVARPSRENRNAFAHNVWGICDELPDAILSMKAQVVVNRNITLRQVHEVDGVRLIRPKDFDHSQVMVWRKPDFDDANDNALNSQMLHGLLYQTIAYGIEQSRRQLLNLPEVQQAIEQLCRQKTLAIPLELHPPAAPL